MTPLITLTTDFGADSPYVAQMKGVLLDRLPVARLVDITHSIPAQDVMAAAIVLADTCHWFPAATVHIGVVDPGVGTSRRILAGRLGESFFVGPDNGLFSLASMAEVVSLDVRLHWLPRVSDTFHGRDIMAPVAAALARGVPLSELGQFVDDWIELSLPEPEIGDGEVAGQVVHVDSFGNLITNVSSEQVGHRSKVWVGATPVPLVRTYGQAESTDLVALIGSSGHLEIAIVGGNAERTVGRDIEVVVRD